MYIDTHVSTYVDLYRHSQLQIGWHRILRLFVNKNFTAVPGVPRIYRFSISTIHYVVLIVNPMGRILVRWQSLRNNLEILCHPICNRLYAHMYIDTRVSTYDDVYKYAHMYTNMHVSTYVDAHMDIIQFRAWVRDNESEWRIFKNLTSQRVSTYFDANMDIIQFSAWIIEFVTMSQSDASPRTQRVSVFPHMLMCVRTCTPLEKTYGVARVSRID